MPALFDQFKDDHPWFGTGRSLGVSVDHYPVTDADPHAAAQLRLSDWLAEDVPERPLALYAGPTDQPLRAHTKSLLGLGPDEAADLLEAIAVRVTFHSAVQLPDLRREAAERYQENKWPRRKDAPTTFPADLYASYDWVRSLSLLAKDLLTNAGAVDAGLVHRLAIGPSYTFDVDRSYWGDPWFYHLHGALGKHAYRLAREGALGPETLPGIEKRLGVLCAAHNEFRIPLDEQTEWGASVLERMRAMHPDHAHAWGYVFNGEHKHRRRESRARPSAGLAGHFQDMLSEQGDAFRSFVIAGLRAAEPKQKTTCSAVDYAYGTRLLVWASSCVMDGEVAGLLAALALRTHKTSPLVTNACLLVLRT